MMAVLLVGVAAIGLGLAVWARRRLVMISVVGASMQPTLRDGDMVLALRRRSPSISAGQIVVIEQPPPWRDLAATRTSGLVGEGTPTLPDGGARQRRWLIKRVASTAGEPVPAELASLGPTVPPGCVLVLGDNPDRSDDSRRFGFLPVDEIRGVVVWQPGSGRPTKLGHVAES